jgi:hypothetical protein
MAAMTNMSTNQIDLNETLEYVDPVNVDLYENKTMETNEDFTIVGTNKRKYSHKREHLSDSDDEVTHNKFKMTKNNEDEQYIVIAKSPDVNLTKVNPIQISRGMQDLVGPVSKIFNQTDSLKIICDKNQAKILKKENKLGKYKCTFIIQEKKETKKAKGISFGINLDIPLDEIHDEISSPSIQIDKISRLQKFDKDKNQKIDTTTVIIEFASKTTICFPTCIYLGYQKFTIKEFIPQPIRCYNCQMYGHIATNCRGKLKCPCCAQNHKFEDCTQREEKENYKCANCNENHSAAYKGCETFKKAKEIKIISKRENIDYVEATKIYKQKTECKQTQPINIQQITAKEQVIDENKIVTKVMGEIRQKQQQEQAEIIDKVTENLNKSTKKEDIIEEVTQATQNRCKCKIPLEGLITFIVKTINQFANDQFLQKTPEKQLQIIASTFETYTNTKLSHTKLIKMLLD